MKVHSNLFAQRKQTWVFDLTITIQVSLAAFAIGGAAVSMEMWEGYLLIIVMMNALYQIDFGQPSNFPAKKAPISKSS